MGGPRVVRTSFVTTQPELARQYLLDRGATDVTVDPVGFDRFRFAVESFDDGTLGVRDLQQTGAVRIGTAPTEVFHVVVVAEGSVHVSDGRQMLTVLAGECALIGPRLPHRVRFKHCRIRAVSMGASYLRRGLAEFDPPAGAELEAALSRPRSAGETRQVAATAAFVRNEILSRPDGCSADVLMAARHLMAATLISAFTPRRHPQDDSRTGDEIDWAMHRALTYIDAHAREPLTLDQIASSAGVRPRTLQELFGKQLGTSPFAYVQYLRLAGARADLLSARPEDGASVALIATRWHFTSAGHFAAAYRRQFGELPRETLHR